MHNLCISKVAMFKTVAQYHSGLFTFISSLLKQPLISPPHPTNRKEVPLNYVSISCNLSVCLNVLVSQNPAQRLDQSGRNIVWPLQPCQNLLLGMEAVPRFRPLVNISNFSSMRKYTCTCIPHIPDANSTNDQFSQQHI